MNGATSIINKQHIVTIIPEGGSCTVVPKDIVATVEDKILFQNLAKGQVKIIFPEKQPFAQNELLLEDGQESTLIVKAVDEYRSYSYAVYSSKHKEFACKSQMPRIIIYEKKI